MRRMTIHAAALSLAVFFCGHQLASAPLPNTPHSAYGTVRYADGTFPATIEISARITARPQEVLYHYSVGCGYDSTSGTWYIGCANFASSWQIGDTLEVRFDDLLGNTASVQVVLTGAAADKAEGTVLTTPVVSVTLATSPTGLTVFVNDTAYTAPAVFSWEAGTQQEIRVDSLSEGRPGSRYRFLTWNDSQLRERLFTVPVSPVTITASFSSEHYLDILSDYGQPEGEGWYAEGDTAEIAVTSPVYLTSDERARFAAWWGSGEGAYSGSNRTALVPVNGPVSEQASWIMQYRLSLSVTPPAGGSITVTPSGSWFDTGTVIQLEAVPDTAMQFSFSAWHGDISGSDNPLSLSINSSLTVQAAFSNSDQLPPLFEFIYPPHAAKSVRRNSQLYFRIYDPSPSSGIDVSSLTAVINSDTLISDGQLHSEHASLSIDEDRILTVMLDMNGHLTPGTNGVTITGSDYMDNHFSKITLFNVIDEEIFDKQITSIDAQGGSISIPNALGTLSAGLTVPSGVYLQPFHLTTGTCDPPGNLPENAEPAGAVIYIGPVGHVFPDSLVLQLPYTLNILHEVNASNPAEIPVYFYSFTADAWKEIETFRITSDYVYMRIGETGIYCFGDRHLTHVDTSLNEPITPGNGPMLRQNYPNPFNQSTCIPFSLIRESSIAVVMYDIRGRVIRRLIEDEAAAAGNHIIIWDGRDAGGSPVPSGVYIYSLTCNGSRIMTRRLIISR